MGLCASSGGKNQNSQESREIDKMLKEENLRESKIPKVLLLGTGESGKSTVFKQMVKLYGTGLLNEGDSEMFRHAVRRNISESIYELCVQSEKLGDHDDVKGSTEVLEENRDARDAIINGGRVMSEDETTSDKAKLIAQLWDDPGIQVTYEHRNLFQLYDSAAYFLSDVQNFLDPNYEIQEEDVLRARVRTTGMIQKSFKMGDNFEMKLVDVGGQRSERKKWIKWFDGVTAVMFVTAVSEYNQVCFEDEFTNRMDESMNVFRDNVNSEWFEDSSFILFLNKKDLFLEKLEHFPLKEKFEDYEPVNEPNGAFEFIAEKFLDLVDPNSDKTVFVHFTTATDSDNMVMVLDAVKHTLLKRALAHANLV